MTQYHVLGRNAVLSTLTEAPERVAKVYVAEGLKPDPRLQEIHQQARGHGLVVQTVPRSKLDQMLGPDAPPHQGVLAVVAAKPLKELADALPALTASPRVPPYPLLFLLDGVTDPRNLGAILRVADGVGADGVLLPDRRSATVGPAMAKAAAGAEDTVDLILVGNRTQAIEACQKAGFWVVGAVLSDDAQPYQALDYKMPTLIVLGSEGDGLSNRVAAHCDFKVQLPMWGKLQSLNVATAAAVLGYAVRTQQGAPLPGAGSPG